jgi:hypothetical protein
MPTLALRTSDPLGTQSRRPAMRRAHNFFSHTASKTGFFNNESANICLSSRFSRSSSPPFRAFRTVEFVFQYSKALLNVDMKSVLSEHGVEAGCEADAAVDMEPTLHDLEAAA